MCAREGMVVRCWGYPARDDHFLRARGPFGDLVLARILAKIPLRVEGVKTRRKK